MWNQTHNLSVYGKTLEPTDPLARAIQQIFGRVYVPDTELKIK